MKSFSLLVTILVLCDKKLFAYLPPRADPVVKTKQGLVKGVKSVDGNYSMFLGVPYAQVDMANPFGPALSPPAIDGVFEAYHGTVKCPQMSASGVFTGTLDCLRLNIFVPASASITNPAAVLIWIHGGHFKYGSIAETDPKEIVVQGVLVVTINYRLGVYGFMCLDIPTVPGNQGLKDQFKAFQWVKSNIAGFGGNSKKITIAGQDAGSSSVLFHLYSKYDKLYHQVIAQSGTPLSEGMFVIKDTEAAKKIASFIGTETLESDEAIDILSNAYPSLVVTGAHELGVVLGPCKEKAFMAVDSMINKNPFVLSNPQKVRETSILIGHTSKEQLGLLFEENGKDYLNRDPFVEKIRGNFKMDFKEITKAARFVRHFYIGDEELTKKVVPALEDFASDFKFCYSVHRSVRYLLEQNPANIYQYMFSYVGDSDELGASHGTELEYLFHTDECMNAKDQLIADRIITLWANFIIYGNPTPLSLIWMPVSNTSQYYLNLDSDVKLGARVFKERMTFWELFYELYGKYHYFAGHEKAKREEDSLVFLKRSWKSIGLQNLTKDIKIHRQI